MKTLLVLLGPTGVGKTETALTLAEALGSPVLNCDSRQLYADLPIGTAAPTPAQQARVPHHFVGTLGIREYYSAARYEQEALALMDTLFQQHDTLLLCGGSMMYMDAVCKGIDDIPTIDHATRAHLSIRLETEGLPVLAAELQRLDPEYAAQADLRNTRRVVHALEIIHQTGQTYSSFRRAAHKQRPFRIVKAGLNLPRPELFARINARVGQMVADGLVEEARRMLPYRSENALNTVGYKEMFRHLDGEWTLEEAVERIRKNTRVYAKKQLTWFARDRDIRWFAPGQTRDILNLIHLQP